MNYKLNVQDRKVDYLMMAGKDIVRATTTEERAKWAMEQKGVKYECIGEHPEYAIHCGEFYFASIAEPEKPKKKRRTKDKVCNNDYCDLE
jgi:hypothetical protein